jgi:hypothetical protein
LEQLLVVLEHYCFLSVTWYGEAFYGLAVQGFGVFFLLFGFFFLPSGAVVGKYSVWSAEGLPSTFGAGSGQVGGQAGGQAVAAVGSVGRWAAS